MQSRQVFLGPDRSLLKRQIFGLSLVLSLMPSGETFKAIAGVDNNFDTGGVRGSVQLSVELGGKELFRTPTFKSSDAPVPVELELPKDTRQIVLKVDATAAAVHGSQFTVHSSRFTVHGSRITVHASRFTVHASRPILNS